MSSAGRTRLRVLRTPEASIPPGSAALLTLVRVANRANRLLAEVVRPHGLTASQAEVLLCLRLEEGISQQDLAERLLVTKGNVCVTLQKMEVSGWIDRRPDPVDQRAHRLYLTDAGRLQLERAIPDRLAIQDRITALLSDNEKNVLLELLTRLQQSLDDIDRASPDGPLAS